MVDARCALMLKLCSASWAHHFVSPTPHPLPHTCKPILVPVLDLSFDSIANIGYLCPQLRAPPPHNCGSKLGSQLWPQLGQGAERRFSCCKGRGVLACGAGCLKGLAYHLVGCPAGPHIVTITGGLSWRRGLECVEGGAVFNGPY
ncbi:unnamed protein product [Prunus armeniaca]|uniref:Uncharacterized protein n=1 Tax=Prunus armeniaca TaxID=36596 RepID=A0A6J5UEL4_PRUAR|nr:unnamed protein product [Prunus armeniaca]